MSEDLSKFKKKVAVRSSLIQFEAFIEQLNDKESNLSLLNTLIEDSLSVDTITEDMEASEEIKEKIIFWKTKLSSKIRRINSESIQVDTVSPNIQIIDSNSFECMNINLPKLQNKYSGKYSEWLDFYNLFESSIHNNNRLNKVDKFNYLKSYFCGNALACINGFPISDDNYDRALDLLKDTFGNKNMLFNAHLSNLLNLTPVRNPTDIVGLRNLYDRAERQIRSLESLGVKRESYSNLLTPILLKQIPPELVLEFNRSQKDEGFDLSALLQFLHLQIRSRERASQINNYKLYHYSNPPQDRTKNKGSYFPGQRMMPRIEKENLSICTFGAKETETKTLNIVKIKLKNRNDPNLCIEIEAVEIEHISITNLPTPDRNIDKKFRYLKNVQLADPYEFNDKEISILIGAYYYYQVVTGRITRLNKILVTVETLFGWSLQGQTTDSEELLTMSVIANESNISKQLSEFWDLENLGIEAEVSDEENIDNDIMSEFEAGISYQNKRYKVKFPWKPNMKTLLENNEEIARKRFLKLRSRFKNYSSLFEDYKLVVTNYLSEKIIERVPFEEENLKDNIFFICHIEQ
ncbi:reverse transcriptase domain-containing protein [Trichonephila clavipes]|nr:reverse transcriptase domain-containing protein [Trichonephila clavipes]